MSYPESEGTDDNGYGSEFCDGYGYGMGMGVFGVKGFGNGKAPGKNHSTTSDKDFQHAGR